MVEEQQRTRHAHRLAKDRCKLQRLTPIHKQCMHVYFFHMRFLNLSNNKNCTLSPIQVIIGFVESHFKTYDLGEIDNASPKQV